MYIIHLDGIKINVPGDYKELTKRERKALITLYSSGANDVRTKYFAAWAKQHKLLDKIDLLSNEQLHQLMHCFSWIPEQNPTVCLIDSFRFKWSRYYAIKGDLAINADDFRMIDHYTREVTSMDCNAMAFICAIVYRKKGEAINDEILERQAIAFKKLPVLYKQAAYIYAQSNIIKLSHDFKMLFDGKEAKINLGWAGCLTSVAETNVFGDLEKVKNTDIREVCFFLLKKKIEADANDGKN